MLRATILITSLLLPANRLAASTTSADAGVPIPDVVQIIGTRVVDVDGNLHRFGLSQDLSPVALVFLEPTCVISRRYAPALKDFARHADEQGIELYAIVSEPNSTAAEVRAWRDEYGVDVPLIFDSSGDLAMRLRPRVVPESFIVGRDDVVAYRGRIDDRFAAVGQLRPSIKNHDLRDAMTAVAKGRAPAASDVRSVGCAFEAWTDELPEKVTFNRDIDPIMRTNCESCHRPGNVAPFPLLSYQDARRRARMIAQVTDDKFMPPWWVRPGHGQFWGARVLSDRQIGLIGAWAAQGAPRGTDADRLPRPETEVADKSNRPKPSLTVKIPNYALPATGPDVYRYFVFPGLAELAEDQVLLGVDIEAGDPAVVHHVDYFVDYSGRARALDEADPEPGFAVFGTGSFLSYFDGGFLGAWAPGSGQPYEPKKGDQERLGQFVRGGGDLVMEIHYHLSGKATTDDTSMSLYLDAPDSVDRHIGTLYAGTTDVDIPAGATGYERHFWMDVPADVDIFNLAAHMHYLGQDVSAVVTFPNGERKSIFKLDRWDFRWQAAYSFLEPIRVPGGSRIDFHFRFDNSSDNYANPFDPPVRATWGWGTDQEMAEVYLTAAPVSSGDLDRLRRAAYSSWSRPSRPGYEMPMDLSDPKQAYTEISSWDFWQPGTRWTLGILASKPEQFDRVIEHFAKAASDDPSAERHAQHGMMLVAATGTTISNEGRFALLGSADKAFDRALESDPKHWGARFAKASAFHRAPADLGLKPKAIEQFEILIAQQEKAEPQPRRFATTYALLGDAYFAEGDTEKAVAVWQRGSARFPGNRQLQSRLSPDSAGGSP